MKNISVLLFLFITQSVFAYRGEIRYLDSKDKTILFNLSIEEKIVGDEKHINALFKSSQVIVVEESAVINKNTAELISASIQQFQTKEKGTTEVVGDKVKLTFEAAGKPMQKKEFKKPKHLVAPGNFEDWLLVNFEMLQKEKSASIDFLIWDRLETIQFKISYLGLVDLAGQKAHSFKLNIDNFFLATFISPIKIWKSEDMKRMLRYEGLVAVKQVKGPELKNLDAEVVYYHDLKAAQ
ncbi:MAG: hypothetical protein H7328_08880 [Bdellovibrio sp.]|nr:hypothetical protein [Bdellovibrio sp.]